MFSACIFAFTAAASRATITSSFPATCIRHPTPSLFSPSSPFCPHQVAAGLPASIAPWQWHYAFDEPDAEDNIQFESGLSAAEASAAAKAAQAKEDASKAAGGSGADAAAAAETATAATAAATGATGAAAAAPTEVWFGDEMGGNNSTRNGNTHDSTHSF